MSISRFLFYATPYLIFIPSVATYLLFAWDKHRAHYGKSRVPEALLIVLSVLFGAFGALCAMVLFSHKTRKPLFTITVPALLIVQLAAIILLKTLT